MEEVYLCVEIVKELKQIIGQFLITDVYDFNYFSVAGVVPNLHCPNRHTSWHCFQFQSKSAIGLHFVNEKATWIWDLNDLIVWL